MQIGKIRSTAIVDVILAVIGYLVGMLIVMILSSPKAHAQTAFWIEERTFIKNGVGVHRVDGLLNGAINKKLGLFVWFQVDRSYAQAYGGLTISPKPWLQLAVGPGLEQASKQERVGGYLWIGKGNTSLLFIPEYGGSGFWMKTEFTQKINAAISTGIISERYKGSGPKIEINIPSLKMKLWVAPLWEKGTVNGLAGVRWYFF